MTHQPTLASLLHAELSTSKKDEVALTKRFVPYKPTATPIDIFTADQTHGLRLIHKGNPTTILIFTAGASIREELKDDTSAAGFTFVVCPPSLVENKHPGLVISQRLEHNGAIDDEGNSTPQEHTASCASIRAIVAALQYRPWPEEAAGYKKIVIATHDANIVESVVDRIAEWKESGWMTQARGKTKTAREVKNRESWRMLVAGIEEYKKRGLEVEFWKIGRKENELALERAKMVCYTDGAIENYVCVA